MALKIEEGMKVALIIIMLCFLPAQFSGKEMTSLRRVKETSKFQLEQIGFIGLGRMGQGMAKRLLKNEIKVFGYDIEPKALAELEASGGKSFSSLRELVKEMKGKKLLWLMVPDGETVDKVIAQIKDLLNPGDIIIDGANSHYLDTIRRAGELKSKGVYYLDVGSSGGIRAVEGPGMSLMVGGEETAYRIAEPLLKALAWKDENGRPLGYGYLGGSGVGHFVKAAVHNGIEYGFFQALAEGMEVLAKLLNWDIDALREIVSKSQRDSLLRSWTLRLAEETLSEKEEFQKIAPHIGGGKYGSWGQQAGDQWGVDTAVLDASLDVRAKSKDKEPLQPGAFANRLIAGMRFYMGGHPYKELAKPVKQEDLLREIGSGNGILPTQELIDKIFKAIAFTWLQALKEGYELMEKSPFEIDEKKLAEVNRIWKNGAVIRSYLVELAQDEFSQGRKVSQAIEKIREKLGLKIEDALSIQDIARRLGIPTPALDAAIQAF